MRESVEAALAVLKAQLNNLDKAIAARIEATEALAAAAANLRSFKGCGPAVAATLLGEVPELGRLSGKEIAALIGLALVTRNSGKATGRAVADRGRLGVRQAPFQAARCAIRWNPVIGRSSCA